MSTITPQIVQDVATMARLQLEEAKIPALSADLSKIMTWVEKLQEVDTTAVEPMRSPVSTPLPQREDVAALHNTRDDVLQNAPKATHGFYTVPKVVE